MKNQHGFSHFRSTAESGAASFESIIWILSCLATILGVILAAHSTQPLLWLAAWPVPVTLACTIFIFFRQGFHLEDGVLVLGRQPKRFPSSHLIVTSKGGDGRMSLTPSP
jgi:hypothetical protein